MMFPLPHCYNGNMSQDSVFSRIVTGEIPCYTVYEDGLTMAFLDIHPIQPGHTLVIPKKQVKYLWDLDDETYQAVMSTAKKVAIRLRQVLGVPYIGEEVVGIDVPHAHLHLIPFTTTTEFRRIPVMTDEPDRDALATMAAKLQF